MTSEREHFDRKSLRRVAGRTADFDELARDCVCLANAAGGTLTIGVEDAETAPPPTQRIDVELLERIRRRVGELTVNVQIATELHRADNGGDYIVVTVARSIGVASTTDGRYFLRVADTCLPVVGDDVLRLTNERPAIPWEAIVSLGVMLAHGERSKLTRLAARLRASDRVKPSVKEKADSELMEHYGLAIGGRLTNLGVLLIGTAADRMRLGTAPVVQAIRYDDLGNKVGKHVWDDHGSSPIELVDAIWEEIPDFRESYELPDGMFRTSVPAFDEAVIRELVVNALVHRPYTQRGDIYLNLFPDRLEIVNPGRLPLGVTPRNILHASRRRNDAMARVFHDLKLMEREGSGFDLIYERLLSTGRAVPKALEGPDAVHVIIPRRVIQPGVVRLIGEADQRFQLTQRERIVLSLLAQSDGLGAAELAATLELDTTATLRPWLGRLLDWGLVEQSGRTRATRYYVSPGVMRGAGLDRITNLRRVQPHRLKALIIEDLERYPGSAAPDIHRRIGPEIPPRTLRRVLTGLIEQGRVIPTGQKRWRRYSVSLTARDSVGSGSGS